MDSAEMLVSVDALNRIIVCLLYVPICLFTYWQLIPRLSPTSNRIASFMLAAQILVIAVALEVRPTSFFESWLWHLDLEYNIPATLASAQLALVSGAAIATAGLARSQPACQRLYLVAIGLVFLFLARDEYFTVHERILNWKTYYVALGAAVAATTVAVAVRTPRPTRIWIVCLLTGLAMSAAGSIIVDARPEPCENLGFLRLDGCLPLYIGEESLEFLGIWLVLVAILGMFSDAVPTPQPRIRRILYILPALWTLLLFFNSLIPRLELPILAQPASVQFESRVNLLGYRIDSGEGVSHVRLYVSSSRRDYRSLGYSLHLVDQASGKSVASRDKKADRQHGFWLLGPDHALHYLQWMEVRIPPGTPANRALWVVLTLWRKKGDKYVFQKVITSDLKLLSESQVVLAELVLPAHPPASETVPLVNFENGFTLDAADMPEIARAGESLTIRFAWRSEEQGHEDHSQYFHLGHVSPPRRGGSVEGAESVESDAWFVYDQEPLGPRLPTRLWYRGLADTETWQVPLPSDLEPGKYRVFTGLYRAGDQQRVPATDVHGMPFVDARVPLGAITIEP